MNAFEKEVQYKNEFFAQKTPYLQWLKQQEAAFCERYTGPSKVKETFGKQLCTLPFSSCMDSLQNCGAVRADVIYLFVKEDGELSEYVAAVMLETFSDHGDAALVYADEDYHGSLLELYDIREGFFDEDALYRGAPWFKPDFSPDTLASFFYIGSIFAIRGDVMLAVMQKYGRDISIYELVYRIFMDALQDLMLEKKKKIEKIVHIPSVLYTNNHLAEAKRIDSSERIKELYDAGHANQDKVSIVIPSKDNAKVLGKCLETLTEYTDYDNYEIIIVDNGSSPEQKMCITDMIDSLNGMLLNQNVEKVPLPIKYLYEKTDFNFSAMCNKGAKAANGSYLLFLNDDIEVMDTDEGARWLKYMMKYAQKHHVGAVGAKLYYPPKLEDSGCYRIQHVGITNMGIGPAHKLGGMEDKGCLYHGHNTQNYDMLAVTAACMLVKRSIFDEIGGFDAAFPIAYNDVAFCFALHQKGYFNVQVNDAVLIHHESLSRGQDTSSEKTARLNSEKQRLYNRYPSLRAKDPFYSPNLVQWKKDVEYNTGYLYEFDRMAEPIMLENSVKNAKRERMLLKKCDFRDMLKLKSGLAAKIYDRLTGYSDLMLSIDNITYDISNVTIQGWCAVRNTDNAGIPKKLWLINNTRNADFRTVYEFDIAPKLREDAAALFDGDGRTKNTALSGIQIIFQKGCLKPGSYRIGVVCRGKLICDLEKRIEIQNA